MTARTLGISIYLPSSTKTITVRPWPATRPLVERMIRDKGIDVMHGVHVDWDTHGDRRSQDIDELIRNKHREGYEALVKVTPDLLVCQVWGPDTRENDDTHKYPCIRGTESGGARSLSDGQRERPRSQPYQPHYRAGASLYVSFAKDGNPQARCYQDVTFKVKIIKVKDSKYFIQREGATEQEDWLFQSFDEHACDQVTVRPLDYEPQLRKGATVWLSTGPADNPDACYRDVCQRIRIVDIEGSTYTIEYLDATVTDGRIQPASARGVDHNACKAVTDRPPSHPPSSAP